MSLGHHHAGLPPGNLHPPDDLHDYARSVNGYAKPVPGSRTPLLRAASSNADGSHAGNNMASEADTAIDEDPRIAVFRDLYKCSEAKIHALFDRDHSLDESHADFAVVDADPEAKPARADDQTTASLPPPPPPPTAKKPARKMDDDDYDDYDDDDEPEAAAAAEPDTSPVKPKSLTAPQDPSSAGSPGNHRPSIATSTGGDGSKELKKETLEEIRKKLEEDKKATEEAAKRSFHTLFYTLENDRDAMLDQQRLEESERQVEAEMSGQANAGNANGSSTSNGYGSLSSANLGASSLTLKNLIARIDMKRTMVQASDAELRSLMSEVRKNRSKWASEDKIGQEELYEAAEKVLSELKAMTEHSTAFLTRVNKRDAPDYYTSKEYLFFFFWFLPLYGYANPSTTSNQTSYGPGNYDQETQSFTV